MQDMQKLKEEICLIGKRMYDHKLAVANDGNISCRLDNNLYMITPTRMCKADLTPEDIVIIDDDFNVVEGAKKPSTEAKVHLAIYHARPDIHAVVHAHAPFSMGFAIAGQSIMTPAVPSIFSFVGPIPCSDYGTPSTYELADSVAKLIKDYDCMFLANHGTVTAGKNLQDAFYKTERVELLCTATLVARFLGGERNFTEEEIRKLNEKKERQAREGLA